VASPTFSSGVGQVNTISSPFILNGVKYRTETIPTLENGRVVSSEVRLQKAVGAKGTPNYPDYAVSRDGGRTWVTPGTGRGTNENKPLTTANSGLSAAEIKGLQPGGSLNKASLDSANKAVKKAGATPEQTKASLAGNPQSPSKDDKSSIDISKQLEKDIGGTNSGLPGAGSNALKYPVNLNPRQDHILFTQVEYSPKPLTDTSTTTGGNPLALGKRSDNRKILGKVILPIQSGILDGNTVVWGEDKMNALDLFQINAMKAGITKGFEAASKTTEAAASKLSSDAASEKAAFGALITQALTQKNALARSTGQVVNDNNELLFQSPSLRNFSFTFKLSAREASEAKTIANIIRFFKQGMAPKRTQNSYFLKSPNTFLIEYRHNNGNHPGVNKIKECALMNCSVNYTPDGYYTAHADGYLVSYDMTMQFQELEPVFNDEYAELNNQIGY
jgi:hypothetical protein